jgi:hypothetical protein
MAPWFIPNTNVGYSEWGAALISTWLAYRSSAQISVGDGQLYWIIGFITIGIAAWLGGLRYSMPPRLVKHHFGARVIGILSPSPFSLSSHPPPFHCDMLPRSKTKQ